MAASVNPGPVADPAAAASSSAADPARAASPVEPAAPLASGVPPAACWRCDAAAEPGVFCKFCGAKYADAGASARPAASGSVSPAAAEGNDAGAKANYPSLVAILKDGSDGRTYQLAQDVNDVGRSEGEIILPDDPYLSPRHARIARRGESWLIRGLDSVNGVYARLRDPVDVKDGDMLLLGQQVLKFETLSEGELPLGPARMSGVFVFGTPEVPRIARLVQYTTEGIGRDVYHLYRDETIIGRETGDIVFTDDPFLSRRHAAITVDRSSGRFVLRDLGSSNGTAIRFRDERVLVDGDMFRIGRHLFRFDLNAGEAA